MFYVDITIFKFYIANKKMLKNSRLIIIEREYSKEQEVQLSY